MTDAGSAYVEKVAAALAGAGFPRMPANVLMTLIASSEPGLTSEQLGRRIGASAAAVSGAVRYLESVGMAHRRREPGRRHYVWHLTDDSWYTASLRNHDLYDYIVRISGEEADRLPADSAARERIEEMADFMVFVRDALPRVLDEWRAQRGSAR